MGRDDSFMVILPFGVGALFIWWGILVRLGKSKHWFVMARIPTVIIPRFSFGFIPAGLGFLSLGIAAFIPVDPTVRGRVLEWVTAPLWALSILLTAWQPRWILPDWYRWLRDNHGDIMRLLKHEARQNRMWHARVSTQEGLEQWATEVRHKRWLQSRYDPDTVAFMLAEARLDDGWTERVSTEAGLAAWAEEMAAQYRERRQGRRE